MKLVDGAHLRRHRGGDYNRLAVGERSRHPLHPSISAEGFFADVRSGPVSHSWWAMVVLLLVAGSLYLAYVFSYLYLWTVSPQVWPTDPAALAGCSQRR